jgi:prevent-host-death family protein
MTIVTMQIKAGEFKAKCLKLMDEVNHKKETYIITKHGKAVAKLVPIETEPQKELFGALKGYITIKDDLTKPTKETWNAEL